MKKEEVEHCFMSCGRSAQRATSRGKESPRKKQTKSISFIQRFLNA